MDTRIARVERAYALLMGVGDYRAYDDSLGNVSGASDLDAAPHDVRSMIGLCFALGFCAENIHVLLSVRGGASADEVVASWGLGATLGYVGPATAEAMHAQCAWLASALEPTANEPSAPQGILSYSGHGDFVGDELALCPSDVRATVAGADLERAVAYSALRGRISDGAAESLTVMLDCCHAAGEVGVDPLRRGGASLTGRARASSVVARVGVERVIAASSPGGTSWQSVFDGVAHGALCWAVRVASDQWRVVADGGANRLTVSYGELVERAQALLDALSFEQRIAFIAGEGAASLPAFHRGAHYEGPAPSREPDRARHGGQLDPDQHDFALYVLRARFANKTDFVTVATLLSTRTASKDFSPNFDAGMEYVEYASGCSWPPKDANGDPPEALRFEGSALSWGQTPPIAPGSPTIGANAPAWAPGAPRSASLYYDHRPNGFGAAVKLHGSASTPKLSWGVLASAPPATPVFVVSGALTEFDLTTAPAQGNDKWYCPQ